ncbi:MAG: ribonuclease P protein component [Clostridiales bacterium]|nr:ribonuclease P protein component [Clostridiales bacterium]
MSGKNVLRLNSDFHRCYGRGKSCVSPLIVTYAVKNRGLGVRVGITATKKLGSAVERNRCRRIIRAAYSSIQGECSGNYDIVIVARHKTKNAKSTDLVPVIRSQLTQLNVIKGTQ